MSITSIDEMLLGGKTHTQPATPEHQEPAVDVDEPEFEPEREINDEKFDQDPEPEAPEQEEASPEKEAAVDDYGNPEPEKKTYTEDEVNERINKAIRDRLARLERNNQQPQQQPQQVSASQASAGFEYNPDSSQDWQQQLESFVEQTVSKMTGRQQQQQQQQREQQAQAEFEIKFHQGMGKFQDFTDVVGQQPITDAMTIATRAMKDPASFLYAAAKRHAPELQRISQLPDQYAQMVEMGKLEERMRKTKEATKAPRPLSATKEDTTSKPVAKKDDGIDALIAQSDAKRRAQLVARRR
ncbi:hypothetical protein [Thiocapsa sp. N5-Cardenillas]|uniref:hypothetical protein n=1 Tax=Thiocapsa sp. N5-Cardenillas TaxID=3137397 RepID=UPI0035B08E0C